MMKYTVTSSMNDKKFDYYDWNEALAFAELIVEMSQAKFPTAYIRTEKNGEPLGPIDIVRPKLKLVPKAKS